MILNFDSTSCLQLQHTAVVKYQAIEKKILFPPLFCRFSSIISYFLVLSSHWHVIGLLRNNFEIMLKIWDSLTLRMKNYPYFQKFNQKWSLRLSIAPNYFFFSLAESLPRRSKLPDNANSNTICQQLSSNTKFSAKIGNNLSRSLSNLATDVDHRRKCPKTFQSSGMKPKQYSASSTSLSTIPGKKFFLFDCSFRRFPKVIWVIIVRRLIDIKLHTPW